MENPSLPPGYKDMFNFGLIEALLGRRSRRFFMGAEIPDGVFSFKSKHEPMPLSELEKLLVVAACGGNTAWHHMIYRGQIYAPHLSNYAGAAGGRVFPSAAGFHTSQTFFTDDRWKWHAEKCMSIYFILSSNVFAKLMSDTRRREVESGTEDTVQKRAVLSISPCSWKIL